MFLIFNFSQDYQSMGAKNSAQSRDSQKLNSFYSGIPTEAKLASLENKVAKSKSKYAVRFFVMGFLLEYAFGVGSFYENLNRKSTLRRLNAKKKEDDELEQKHREQERARSV